MKNIRVFLSEKFKFWEVKFSIYLNRYVFVMILSLNCLMYVITCKKQCHSLPLKDFIQIVIVSTLALMKIVFNGISSMRFLQPVHEYVYLLDKS